MSKRKPLDKAQARERRDRMLESAAAADLSLTEGVREMRVIAGMTQEEFARHRGVSARVIKAVELGQGNPTVATLNQIGQFFGLEVGFVPIRRAAQAEVQLEAGDEPAPIAYRDPKELITLGDLIKAQDEIAAYVSKLGDMLALSDRLRNDKLPQNVLKDASAKATSSRTKKKRS